jgi:hypothetical protein
MAATNAIHGTVSGVRQRGAVRAAPSAINHAVNTPAITVSTLLSDCPGSANSGRSRSNGATASSTHTPPNATASASGRPPIATAIGWTASFTTALVSIGWRRRSKILATNERAALRTGTPGAYARRTAGGQRFEEMRWESAEKGAAAGARAARAAPARRWPAAGPLTAHEKRFRRAKDVRP